MTTANSAPLEGRVIAVTGAAGGIGRGIARAILEAGGRVALLDLPGSSLADAAAGLNAGDAVTMAEADVTDAQSLDAAFAKVVAAMGRLDGLVNNAGVVRLGPADGLKGSDIDLEMAVNVKGVLLAAQAAARRFGPEGGAIVNIASNAGKVGYPNMAGYNASKAAVINLTRSLSLEWAARNINVNAVCPGGVATDMLKTVADFIVGGDAEKSEEMMKNMVPSQLGRHIQPVEVGRVVAFLLSDTAKIIRGQAITIDGGDTPY
ncbi:short chain dehydrogenase [Nitratireductor indicus C115]|uniref:Short chain dehydrogenase n=1 Tax=Nitratireductor indicus C115 TaxID=1231190 RepID=K2N1P2_9HYPH|nr:SDR family oxidoreductase [Nitratireductor indicus]EKF41403.1 short chain dehydrogenase [Nitratireductor indicus C115]SFQ72149.1 NAD(P)-dependent dehydrogenase, short-chain alcohol dehydrogenase family [Nitratireductor indicus]